VSGAAPGWGEVSVRLTSGEIDYVLAAWRFWLSAVIVGPVVALLLILPFTGADDTSPAARIGLFGFGCLGGGILLNAAGRFTSRPALRLSASGIEAVGTISRLWRRQRLRWTEVRGIEMRHDRRSPASFIAHGGRRSIAATPYGYKGETTDHRMLAVPNLMVAHRRRYGTGFAPPPIEMRPATQADREWIWHTQCAAMGGYITQQFGTTEREQREYFDEHIRAEDQAVVSMGGRQAGFVSVRFEGSHLYLADLVLEPRHQGVGIGSELLFRLHANATQLGLPVRLQVLHSNPRARELYERMGYLHVQDTATHAQMAWRPPVALPNDLRTGR
jgi:ribosomal protein S18 acetylase RimI-like enzyme